MYPCNVNFPGALSAGAKQTVNNQSEQRNMTYTRSLSEPCNGLECLLSSVTGEALIELLETVRIDWRF